MAKQWRGLLHEYADRLDVSAATPIITLGEGGTPLIPARYLSERTGANGAVARPQACANVFSAMRSCATATQSAEGCTRVRAASARSACAGTFSNSVVTASHSDPRVASASASR